MSRPTLIYSLPKIYGVKSCVYKLFCHDRYVIIKAKDHEQSVQGIQKALNQFLRNSELQRSPTNLYYHFFTYVAKQKESKFIVEILKESENAYDLLVSEQISLNVSRKDKKCLNNNVDAYIPAFNDTTNTYGWIPKNAYLNFKKWLKSNTKAK